MHGLKDERVVTITYAFQKILDESNQKPNKTWIYKVINFMEFNIK